MIKELLTYQETDAKLKAIEVSLSTSEERKKAVAAKKFLENVNDMAAKIDQRAGELAQSYKNLAEKQKSFLENIKEYDSIIDTCADEDEVAYIQKKAMQLADNVRNMNAELKKLEETVKEMVAQYNALRKKTSDAKKQYVEYGQKYNALKAENQEEKEKIEKELKLLEKKLEPEVFALYTAKRMDKIFPILYPCVDNRCKHCGMELSISEVNNLKKNRIAECDNCRRLLYVEE